MPSAIGYTHVVGGYLRQFNQAACWKKRCVVPIASRSSEQVYLSQTNLKDLRRCLVGKGKGSVKALWLPSY